MLELFSHMLWWVHQLLVFLVETIALISQSIQLLGPLCLWQCLSIVLVICFVQFKEALKVHRTLMPIKSFQKLPMCLLIRFALQFCFPLSCFMQHVCNTTQYKMWHLILRSILSIPSNRNKGIWYQEMIIASKKNRKHGHWPGQGRWWISCTLIYWGRWAGGGRGGRWGRSCPRPVLAIFSFKELIVWPIH